jgi:hypothetical protein
MQHFFWFDGKQFEKPSQVSFAKRVFYVFDNVELDATVAQDIQRTVRFASVGVVVNSNSFHQKSPS